MERRKVWQGRVGRASPDDRIYHAFGLGRESAPILPLLFGVDRRRRRSRRPTRFCCWRSSRLIERCDAETAEWPDTIPPPGGTNPMDRSVLLIASNVCYFGAEFHLEVVDDDDAQPNK